MQIFQDHSLSSTEIRETMNINQNGNKSSEIFGTRFTKTLSGNSSTNKFAKSFGEEADKQSSHERHEKEKSGKGSRTRVKFEGQGQPVFAFASKNEELSPLKAELKETEPTGNINSDASSLILNYAYPSSSSTTSSTVGHLEEELDTSGICDLGFRNLEKISKLTVDDFRPLSEKYFDKLSLSHNALKQIPHYFLSTFPKLEMLLVLDLSCNQLSFLPNDLDHLVNLTHLNLFLNKLRCLPPTLGQLKHLKWLNIARNPELFQFSYLKKLTGPMLTEKQCFECATNVKEWINSIVRRRAAFEATSESGSDAGSVTAPHHTYDTDLSIDEQLIQFVPSKNPAKRAQRRLTATGEVDLTQDFTFLEDENDTEEGSSSDQLHRSSVKQGRKTLGQYLTKWTITLWVSSMILVLFMSTIIAPFVMNEKSRRFWTSKGLLTLPEFLVDAAIYIGRGLHDLLGGLPCKLFLQKNCRYCYPQSPGFWDFVLWRWIGRSS